MSCGATLRDIKLVNCPLVSAGLTRLSEACPNAVINCIRGDNSFMSTDQVLALGRAAVSWKVNISDADFNYSAFSRVGLACRNLQRCSMTFLQYCHLPVYSASVNAFSDVFVSPKPKLKYLSIHMAGPSSVSSVLEVLIDKGCLLREFSCRGALPSLELLQRFIISQTELQKVLFSPGQQCLCRRQAEVGNIQAMQDTPQKTEIFWVPILGILLKQRNLLEVDCRCKKRLPFIQRTEVTEVTKACTPARTRNISISVCGRRYT